MVLSGPQELGRPLPLPGKLALAAEVLVTYARVRAMLPRHELARVLERLTAGAPERAPDRRDRVLALRLARAVSRVLALPPADSRCLGRSLVLMALLARRGIEGSLVIGVRSGPDFAAHAWVEHGDLALLPSGDYPRLVRMSGGRPAAG